MKNLTLTFALLLLLCACSDEAYETGNGSLSLLRADFVEALTDASTAVISINTDDGETINLTRSFTPSWKTKADTVYRALIYYNKVETQKGTYQAEPIQLSQVFVPQITDLSVLKDGMKTDPVGFESSWVSRNTKYINLDLNVKTGTVDGDTGSQTIGMICTGVEQQTNGTRTIKLRLYHDQCSVPEYYSSELYMSIPLSALPFTPSEGDIVQIDMTTYNGEVTKVFNF